MNEQVTRVVVEQEDKITNKEIAEKNAQIREQQIKHYQEMAKQLNEMNRRN